MKTRTSEAIGASGRDRRDHRVASACRSPPRPIRPATRTVDGQATAGPAGQLRPVAGPSWPPAATRSPRSTSCPSGRRWPSIPSLSTFNSAISGGLNPAVNIVPVLENGPYVVFAPTNDAFAALEPGQLDALKADPAALSKLDYYHVFLGLLGPDDVQGQRPTQEGAEIKVTGKGGDIKVNDTAKVVCGGIQASNARIYIIDKVLDPAVAAGADHADESRRARPPRRRPPPLRPPTHPGSRGAGRLAATWPSRPADASRRKPVDPLWRPRSASACRFRAWSWPSRVRRP